MKLPEAGERIRKKEKSRPLSNVPVETSVGLQSCKPWQHHHLPTTGQTVPTLVEQPTQLMGRSIFLRWFTTENRTVHKEFATEGLLYPCWTWLGRHIKIKLVLNTFLEIRQR